MLCIEEKRKEFDMMCCVVSLFLWTVTINVRFKSPNAGHNIFTITNVNECSFWFSYRKWWKCWFLYKKDMAALQKKYIKWLYFTCLLHHTHTVLCNTFIKYSWCVMVFLLQCVWRRTAKSAAVNQTSVSNAKLATKRTRRDNVVRSPGITQMGFCSKSF